MINVMNSDDIISMQADALAGTQGDWTWETESGNWENQTLEGFDTVLWWDFDLGFRFGNLSDRPRIERVPRMEATIIAQAAEIARLQGMLDRDVASILKGRDVVQPHTHLFDGQDVTSYWKLRAEMGDAAAIRAIKIGEEYRQKAVKTQRKADTEADQASERFKKERDRADTAVAALRALKGTPK